MKEKNRIVGFKREDDPVDIQHLQVDYKGICDNSSVIMNQESQLLCSQLPDKCLHGILD